MQKGTRGVNIGVLQVKEKYVFRGEDMVFKAILGPCLPRGVYFGPITIFLRSPNTLMWTPNHPFCLVTRYFCIYLTF
jgi:hypothetical protein